MTSDAGRCPECGTPGPDEVLVTRPDTVECVNRCGTWVRPDADPAVTWALNFWQRKYRDAVVGEALPPA